MTTKTQTFSYEEAAAFVLPFDKFQGQTLDQAHASDPAYVKWLGKQMVPRNDTGKQIKAAATAYLAGPQKNTPAQAPTKANGHKPAPAPAKNGNGRKPAPQARSNGHSKPAPAHTGDQKQEQHPRIFSIITNKAILHLEDALGIEKVKLFMVSYVKGQGAKATVIHYMNTDDARVVAAQLTTGRFPENYTEYKGSPTGRNGQPLSRVLKIGEMKGQSKRPVVLQVQNGPGKLMGEGAISPIKGQVDAEVTIYLTRHEARKLGHALQSYLLAWQTAKMVLMPPETITNG